MSKSEDNENQNRQELKYKRNRLYQLFLKHPKQTRLALEIKVLDDQLAEWTEPSESKVLSVNLSCE